jgi:hypothetical protein
VLSAGFFLAFLSHSGFKPIAPSDFWEGTFLWIALGFFVFPAVSSLKIGSLLELKREIGRAKEDTAALKQQMNVLASTMSAVATSVNTNVVHVNFLQSEERHPRSLELNAEPGSYRLTGTPVVDQPAARSAMELKILNTLWRWQVRKYDDVSTRFLFKIETSAYTQEDASYKAAAEKLIFQRLIGRNEDRWLGLTDEGLRYCRDNYPQFGRDAYFDEKNEPPIPPERFAQVIATIPPPA